MRVKTVPYRWDPAGRRGSNDPILNLPMKTKLILAVALCGAALLSGCVYDEGYGVRRVSISATTSPYYYGDYDAYTPYYSYSGRRYYRSNNRYVYYGANRRPYYVRRLPSRAVYVTPPRHSGHVIRHRHYRR
jgi:hypothetical protein